MNKEKTFEDFLAEKHAEQYEGLDDDMPDDYEVWFVGLQESEVVKHKDEYAFDADDEKIKTQNELFKQIKKDSKEWWRQQDMKIQKPIYKEKEDYPFENFSKLMDWAHKSLMQLAYPDRFRKLKNWEKEEMH